MSSAQSSIRKPLIGFAAFGVVALLLTYIIWSTLERSISGSTQNFSATFNDTSGLSTGDDVRMAGVRVGRVNDISLHDGKARVTFEVEKNQPVLASTQGAIRYQNLIGQRYLALTRVPDADNRPLQAGQDLQQPSQDSFDVTRLLAGFQPVFETLKPEQVNALSQGLIDAFQGDSVSLSNTISQVAKLADDMANRDQVLGAIITNLSVVMRDLAQQGNQVGTVITSLEKIIGNLNGNSAAFGKSIDQIGRTAAGFADVLGSSRDTLAAAASDAKSATRTLIRNGAKLDRMAVDAPIFLGHFPMVLGQGNYLNIYVCDLDIAIGDVLFPPGLINKIGGTRNSEVCQ